jgi:hypothetical protein
MGCFVLDSAVGLILKGFAVLTVNFVYSFPVCFEATVSYNPNSFARD